MALGSNLGDREAHLRWAIARLVQPLGPLRVSSFIETPPEGGEDQPSFLNAVVVGESALAPEALLEALHRLEAERGRTRPFHHAPRTLDLDLVLYGDLAVVSSGLTVPHPRFRDRGFVLHPLNEVAPELVDPVTGLTVAELLERFRARQASRR